jgi:hypothetical protein
VALYPYKSTTEGDLTFEEGDEMAIIEKHPNNWWECDLHGRRGWVSANFVREINRPRAKTEF